MKGMKEKEKGKKKEGVLNWYRRKKIHDNLKITVISFSQKREKMKKVQYI